MSDTEALEFAETLVERLTPIAGDWDDETRGRWYGALAMAAGVVRRSTPITEEDREWAMEAARFLPRFIPPIA